MGLFSGIKNQLRSVIEWTNPDPDVLFHKWTERGDEIKNASKLIVNPGQGVIFVYQGKVSAVHLEAGTFDLQTGNIPFWTTITRFMQAFESELKVGIYYVKLTENLNLKWGTKSPIKYEDPKNGLSVGLRAFGNFSFRITQPESFFVNAAGTQNDYHVSDAARTIADRMIQPLSDVLAEGNFGYNEVDKQRNELAAKIKEQSVEIFEKLGFALTDFRIESTDFDEATQQKIQELNADIKDIAAAQRAGVSYMDYQKLKALREASVNPGGAAGAGIGIGAGLGLGQMMAGTMMQQAPATPVPTATASIDPMEKLAQLKKMLDNSLISQTEFDTKKADILSKM